MLGWSQPVISKHMDNNRKPDPKGLAGSNLPPVPATDREVAQLLATLPDIDIDEILFIAFNK